MSQTRYIITFDLETSGLCKQPKYNEYYSYKKTKYYDTSRVIQIGYTIHKITNNIFTLTKSVEHIVKPNGFIIDNERFHGITHSHAMEIGLKFNDMINMIKNDFIKADLFVAHNAGFDINVLLSDMYRHGMNDLVDEFRQIPVFCTSIRTKKLMKLPMKFKYGGYKQPNLEELYKWLFKKCIPDTEKRHTALFDAQITSECFIEMLRRKLFELE